MTPQGQQPLPPADPLYSQENELTLKDIILVTKEYIQEIIKRWKIFPIVIIPIAVLLLFSAITHRTVYPGQITFLVTKDEVSPGGIQDILGNFGMGMSQNDESALQKVLQLFQSRRIIENTLFEKITVYGKEDFIANHIIKTYSLEDLFENYKVMGFIGGKEWMDSLENVGNFRYVHGRKDDFNLTELRMLKVLYNQFVGNGELGIEPMIRSTIDEKSGIMSIFLSTVDENLTAEILLKLYDRLSQYYIDKTIEKQKKIYDIAQFKADSIQAELTLADKALAEFEDANRNLVWVRGELKRTKLQRQARLLEILYAETIKQLELSDFALRRKTPYVQIIDEPSRPINPLEKSKFKALLIAFVVGSVIAIIYIVLSKMVRDALKET